MDRDPPQKPADLSPEASQVWNEILAVTTHIGPAHADALRLYAETTASLRAMNPKGSREWQALVLIHLRLARELCLTPATGANLGQAKKEPERKLAKYVS